MFLFLRFVVLSAAAMAIGGCADVATSPAGQRSGSAQDAALAVARDFGYGPGDIRVRALPAAALQSLGPGRTSAEASERRAFMEQYQAGDALVEWSTRLPRRTRAGGLAIVRDGRVVARIQTEFY
jgi:hypothetical protein